MTQHDGAAPDVLVVDDDDGFRALVAENLRDAGFVVRAVASGDEALASARDEPPAVAVVDVNLPGLSGYEVCHALRAMLGARVSVVFVSGDRVESYDRVAGLLLGADDYLVKPFAAGELVARVRALLRRGPAGGESDLTPREREVLGLLAEGMSQAQIARALVIAPKTVGTHIERILGKLGVHSRAEAVAAAYRRELVRT